MKPFAFPFCLSSVVLCLETLEEHLDRKAALKEETKFEIFRIDLELLQTLEMPHLQVSLLYDQSHGEPNLEASCIAQVPADLDQRWARS